METGVAARTAVLLALVRGKSFGLELIERVHAKTGFKLNQGRVYPLLRGLEDEGLLTSWDEQGPDSRGGRPRRYYALTAEGMRAARAQSKALVGLLKLAEVV